MKVKVELWVHLLLLITSLSLTSVMAWIIFVASSNLDFQIILAFNDYNEGWVELILMCVLFIFSLYTFGDVINLEVDD